MIQRLLFVLCVVLGLTGFAAAQVRTVTNADLEKFSQKRVQSEKEYRENYAKLGLPSPEELEKRRTQEAKERDELSARLRGERLERERIEYEQSRRQIEQSRLDAYYRSLNYIQREPPYGGYYFYGVPRFRRPFFPYGNRFLPAWRAAGGSVIYEPGGRSSFVWSPPIQVWRP
ncbi:MAG: hypothetical protein ACT4O9_05445 [Blastocatellia bacterium]